MGRASNYMRLGMVAATFAVMLGACDAGSVVLWPWVEETETQPEQTGTRPPLPPPPLERVDPLDPDAPLEVDQPADPDVEIIPNPNGNTGAPEDGTPFIEAPENEAIPISDTTPTLPVEAIPEAPVTPEPEAPGAPETPVVIPPPAPVVQPSFKFYEAGSLEPGSGAGSLDETTFVSDMAFPIRSAPAYPQSQVYRFGGGVKGGDQCDARNFQAPWRDNYCEKRSNSSSTPYCPNAGIHLGQDIRVGTADGCKAERSTPAADRTRYAIVAVEDGVISNVGSYSVNLRGDGRIYRYLHPNMKKLAVAMGQSVKKGDVIGYVSNDFGGTPTTLHLHFEIKVNTAEHGWQYVPPYSSLLAAYQRRESNPGQMVEDSVNVASTP